MNTIEESYEEVLLNETYSRWKAIFKSQTTPVNDNGDTMLDLITRHQTLHNLHRLPSEIDNIDKMFPKGDYQHFIDIMSKYTKEDKLTKADMKKKIIFSINGYDVYKIDSYKECTLVASGTWWCIANDETNDTVNGKEMFNKYITKLGGEVYIVRKQGHLHDIKFDFAIFICYKSGWYIYNGTNQQVTNQQELNEMKQEGIPVNKILLIHPDKQVIFEYQQF